MIAERGKMFFWVSKMGLEKGVNYIIIPSKVNFGKNNFVYLTDVDDKNNSIDQYIYVNKEPTMPSKNDF